jgi:hypothetical protein
MRKASAGNRQIHRKAFSQTGFLCRFSLTGFAVLLLFSAALLGCKSSTPTPVVIAEQNAQEVRSPVQPEPDERIISPLEEGPDDEKWLGEQWRNFFKSGRYRLINPQEMRLSEGIKSHMYSPRWSYFVNHPYVRWCQGIGAIVVDTTRTDDKRFGLVIFPGNYADIPLRPVWLIRNRDLSRTVLNQTSCSMFITHYAEDGSRESHEALWDKKKKRFSL